MSFPTKPAFVHYGTWNDETRRHPCMEWMEHYTNTFDSKAYDEIVDKWVTEDHLLVRTTGQSIQGAKASLDVLSKEIYAPFAKYTHIPIHLIVYEVENGWEMMGYATLYWKFAVPGKTESGGGVKDDQGNEWDGAAPAAYNFRYRKVDGGIKLSKTEIAADPTAVIVGMLKRGMMKPEDLLK